MKNLTTRDLTTIGLLIALYVVFKQFLSVQPTESFRISTYFIVVAVTGAIYGPITAGIAAAAADILGGIIFPSGFGFYFGFTISAFVEGAIYGLFLYKRKKSVANISLAVITFTIVVSYFLNVLWVTLMNAEPSMAVFIGILQTKLVKSLIMVPIQIAVLTVVLRLLDTTFSEFTSGLNQKKNQKTVE